jgi:hypothetical protein
MFASGIWRGVKMSTKIDLSRARNPYDFSNPITDRNLFSGRQTEMGEICYYLDQAKAASRPINLALLGSRAAGKTSLLNMIELEAKERGFCVVRIDLNEGDIQSQLTFFFKLFDCLFNTACEYEHIQDAREEVYCFGGREGKTYDTYIDMISTYEVPRDKAWRPFVFPVQYAKAMSKGMKEFTISEPGFKSDLELISNELRRPVALLFDECNVLSQKRVLLQMVRNIFMNIPNYMLVFSGTLDLFPVMDDVFSPFARQFKKIEIGAFDDREETEECIVKPLKSIGIKHPSEVFDLESYLDLIHGLTNGRPYEIQLLCHFLFKRVQTGQAEAMQLDVGVFDDVIKELGTRHSINARPFITHIRELDKHQLLDLSLLSPCSGRANCDQLWFIAYVFGSKDEEDHVALIERLKEFTAEDIISVGEEGIITVMGDEFDHLYSKYYARRKGVSLTINDFPADIATGMALTEACEPLEGLSRLGSFMIYPSDQIERSRVFEIGQLLNNHPVAASVLMDESFRVRII